MESRILNFILFTANYSARLSADLSTLFDIGGAVGAVAAGVLSDYSGMSAVTCAGMLSMAVPMVRIPFSLSPIPGSYD